MSYNYASIIPLIGGETIAMEKVFGKRPEYILSYSGFKANDSQLLNYYKGDFYMIKNWDDLMNWQWTVVDGTEDYYSVPYINDIHPEWGSQDGYVSYGSFESLIVILYLLSNMKDMESFFKYCFKKLEVN